MICRENSCFLVLSCKECKAEPIVTDSNDGFVCTCPECGKQLDLDTWNNENLKEG